MADNEQQMVLVAKLVDQVSDKLKEINKAMLATESASRKAHQSGSEAAEKHRKSVELLAKSFEQIKEASVELVKPSFAALGVTAFSLAAAVGAVVEAVKGLGEQGLALEKVSRRAGMAADQIRQLQGIGLRWGVTVGQTNEGLSQFGDLMEQTSRLAPDAIRKWQQMPGAFELLGRKLNDLPKKEKIWATLDFMTHMPLQDQRRRLLGILGLPQDLANMTKKELEEARKAEEEWTHQHPFAHKIAEDADKNFTDLSRSLQGLKDDLGAAFGKPVIEGVEAVNRFLENKDNVDQIKNAFSSMGWAIQHIVIDPLGVMIAAIKQAKDILKGEDHLGKDYSGTNDAETFGQFKATPNKYLNSNPNSFGRWSPAQELAAGMRPISFGGDEASKHVEDPIYRGVLHALQDWYQQITAMKANGGAGGGGFTNASFGGNDGAASARSGGGRFGSKEFPNVGDDDGIPAAGAKIGDLAALRKPLLAEIENNPATKRLTMQMMATEGGAGHGQAALEAMFNRIAMIRKKIPNWSVNSELHSGFYGPINRGAAQRRGIDAKTAARDQKIFGVVGDGSDMIAGRTDQGMVSDPNGRGPGRVKVGGSNEVYNFWKGRRRGFEFSHQDGARFAAEVAQMRKRQNVTDGNLLRDNAAASNATQTADPNASVSIDFKNMPSWVKSSADQNGLFKEFKVNRGFQLPTANEGS